MEGTDRIALQSAFRDVVHWDRRLWALTALSLIVVACGFIAVVLPQALPLGARSDRLPSQLLPAFILLIAILNVYIFSQRRLLKATRARLMEQLARADRALAESLIDPLTGLFNRRYMDYLLDLEAKRVTRAGGVFSILLADLDRFKDVNDQYGHLQGDRVLQEVAGVLRSTFRQTDILIRHGGDEFLALMPNTTEENARAAAERLSLSVAAWNLSKPPQGPSMSLSWGIATYAPGSCVRDTLALADDRMYACKAGRQSTATEQAVLAPA